MDVRNRQEEISYLRASMSRLRDELDQQRRLNVCLKERKVTCPFLDEASYNISKFCILPSGNKIHMNPLTCKVV